VRTLWTDRLGQISLAVTTLFWGAGATLQLLVIAWSQHALGMSLSRASVLQSVTAIGVAVGAVAAASRVSLRKSFSVLPYGIAMGLVVAAIALVDFRLFPAGGLMIGRNLIKGDLRICGPRPDGSARGIGAWRVARAAEHLERVANGRSGAAALDEAVEELKGATVEASAAIAARLGEVLRGH